MSRTLNAAKHDIRGVYFGSRKVYRSREEILRLLLINLAEDDGKWKNRTETCIGIGNDPIYRDHFVYLYTQKCIDMKIIRGYKYYKITSKGLKVLNLLDAMIRMANEFKTKRND